MLISIVLFGSSSRESQEPALLAPYALMTAANEDFSCALYTLDGEAWDGSARYLTGPELEAVYAVIDLLRDREESREIGDALMANAHLLQVQKLNRHIRGRTPFFTQGGFVVNERLVRRIMESPGSQSAVAELAGTLVHEYLHTRQLGADHGPVTRAFDQVAYGFMYAISLPFEFAGVGPADQNGQGHGFIEIDPWRQGIEAERHVFEVLQWEALESMNAKVASSGNRAKATPVG